MTKPEVQVPATSSLRLLAISTADSPLFGPGVSATEDHCTHILIRRPKTEEQVDSRLMTGICTANSSPRGNWHDHANLCREPSYYRVRKLGKRSVGKILSRQRNDHRQASAPRFAPRFLRAADFRTYVTGHPTCRTDRTLSNTMHAARPVERRSYRAKASGSVLQ